MHWTHEARRRWELHVSKRKNDADMSEEKGHVTDESVTEQASDEVLGDDAKPIDMAELHDAGMPSEEDVARRREKIREEKLAKKQARHERRMQSGNPFVRFGMMLSRTAHEIGLIVWPNGGTTAKMTVATIIVVVALAFFILGFDAFGGNLMKYLYSLR